MRIGCRLFLLFGTGLLGLGLVPSLAGEMPDPGSPQLAAEESPRPSDMPDDAALESAGATIGEIRFVTIDVFDTADPRENNWLFRVANRLHVKTRQWVIRQELLFDEDEPYSGRKLAESERLLRATRLFYDARIVPVSVADGRVDVEVTTRDVWTLKGGVRFKRAGGENSVSYGLEDSNFLGTGKNLTVRRSSDVDRTSVLYRYRDPNVAGKRLRMFFWYQDNSDGFLRRFDLVRPFYSLDSRFSAGVSANEFDRTDSLYSLGEIRDQFRHQREFFEASTGFSRGLVGSRAVRWTAGITYREDRFSTLPSGEPPGVLPEDRELVYPWIGFGRIEDAFKRVRNLDAIDRTEDANLGAEIGARLGYASQRFGADRNQAVFDLSWRAGFVPGPSQLVLAQAGSSGRWGRAGAENVLAGAGVRYYLRDFAAHRLYLALGGDVADNLDAENQLLLGGATGLRGYPLRFQEGDRRVLFTAEQRFYTDWHLFRIVRVGAAVFFDAGAAWFRGGAGNADELGLLRDAGFGLRLQSSRSANASMLHVDLAFPLDGDDSISNVQLLVEVKETF